MKKSYILLSTLLLSLNGFSQTFTESSSYLASSAKVEFGNSYTPPPKLASFTAIVVDQDVQLSWSAANGNGSYYNIERSKDATEFVSIAMVDKADNSKAALSFSYLDKEPIGGISYYRLRQTDPDGNTILSKTIAIETKEENYNILNISTENKTLNLEIYSPFETASTIKITNKKGKILVKENVRFTEGVHSVTIPMQGINPGDYLIKVGDETHSVRKKFLLGRN